MLKNFENGKYLAVIRKVDGVATKNGSEYYKLELSISNQKVKNQRVDICIFENNSYFSIDDLIKRVGTNDEKKMIDKLFYCNIEKNKKGYPYLKDFYMTIDRSKLFFDPRKKVKLARRVEKEANLKGVM